MRVLVGLLLSTGAVCGRNLFCGGALVLRIMIVLGEVAKRYISFPFGGVLFCDWVYIDTLGVAMVIMRIIVCVLSLIRSESELRCESSTGDSWQNLELMILLVVVMCILCFCSVGWFSFFIFYEASLMPTVYIILKWGHQPERLKAAIVITMYTVCRALPLLVGLCYIYKKFNCSSFMLSGLMGLIENYTLSGLSVVVWSGLLLRFVVKFPLFFFHR